MKYHETVKKLKENIKKREEIFAQIKAVMVEFSKEKKEEIDNAAARAEVTHYT
jgi:hypothetical protein